VIKSTCANFGLFLIRKKFSPVPCARLQRWGLATQTNIGVPSNEECRKRCEVSLVEGGPPRSVSASAPYAPDQMQGVVTHASSSVSRGVDLSQPVQACFSV